MKGVTSDGRRQWSLSCTRLQRCISRGVGNGLSNPPRPTLAGGSQVTVGGDGCLNFFVQISLITGTVNSHFSTNPRAKRCYFTS